MTVPFVEPDPDDDLLGPYWKGFQERELRLPKCSECDAFEWYPRNVCTCCGGDTLEWVPVSGNVRLYAWSTVHYHFQLPYLADEVPFTTGLVTPVEDESVRLAARIELPDDIEAEADMRLAVDFVENDASDVVAPVYRPAD